MTRQRPISLPLSTHIAAGKAGPPPSVCFMITYATEAEVPSVQWLRRRILKFHRWYPFMTATLEDPAMLHEVSVEEIDYDWLIQERSIGAGKDEARRARAEGRITDDDDAPDVQYLLEAETQRWIREFRTGKPMWQIARYLPAGAPHHSGHAHDTTTGNKAYLAVTISHALADGIGCQEAVMALLESDEVFAQRPEEGDFFEIDGDPPVTLRDIKTLKRMSQHNEAEQDSEAATAIRKDTTVTQEYQTWPQVALPLERDPRHSTSAYSRQELSPDVVKALSQRGKSFGVPTITPTVALALLHAAASVYVPPYFNGPDDRISLTGLIPASDRENMDGQSAVFGGYMCGFSPKYLYPPHPDQSFWDLARDISQDLRDPNQWALKRQARVEKYSKPRLDMIQAQYLENLCGGLNPPWMALAYSSLGRVKLPPGSIDYEWIANFPPLQYQSMAGFATGHEKGMRLYLSWAEGAVCTHQKQREVLRRWVYILHRLAGGEDLMGTLLE